LIGDAAQEGKFIDLFCRVFAGHYGEERFEAECARATDFANVLMLELVQSRCDVAKIYFSETSDGLIACSCVFYDAQLPSSLKFDVLVF
jgi:hypothetical protein